jgi:hypothetical protein
MAARRGSCWWGLVFCLGLWGTTPAWSASVPLPADVSLRPADGMDSLAVATLGRALEYLQIRPGELGFDKLWADDDTFRLAVVERMLGDPTAVPAWQASTVSEIRTALRSPADLVRILGDIGEASDGGGSGDPATKSAKSTEVAAGRGLGSGEGQTGAPALAEAVETFVQRTREAERALNDAFAKFTPEERNRLLVLAPSLWGDWEDRADKADKGKLHREFGLAADTTTKLNEDPILDLAVKLNRPALTRAAGVFVGAWSAFVESARRSLPAEAATGSLPVGLRGDILASYPTPWGRLVVGGRGANTYGPAAWDSIAFVLDPDGDDIYRGRPASALGGLGHSFSACADLNGNDLYEGEGRCYSVGGAILGVSSLLDFAGDDIYRSGDGSLGAGCFGAGFLWDGGGNDFFDGRNLCQGSGAFGIGALISEASPDPPIGPDTEVDPNFQAHLVKVPGTGATPIRFDDNDVYQAARQSQGFASTFGVGLLYDQTGNDLYRAGGRYLHRPLLPHDFQSLSQGFSIGFRPRAGGGVGILIDEEGNDFYDAEVYAQGASYWYSLGLLFDGAGNDRYLATQYAQGAGIHLSVGTLWDRGGDDHYVCKLGVTQGTGHDLSVGWQIDESGNDYYVVSDGQGMSITNSVGISVDGQGNDVYATPGVGQGALTWTRNFCGAGIFLDLEGKDMYPAKGGGADGAVWSSAPYAIGIDLDRDIQLPAEVVPPIVLTAADSARSVQELFDTASIWDVGSAREKVDRAMKALLTKGMAAVDLAAREHLDSQDGLVYRVLQEVGKAYPDSFAARILPRLTDPDPFVQRNVISLLGDLKRKEARAPMERMLTDRRQEKHWNRLIQALGNIGDRAAIPSVRPFLQDPKERRRIGSTVALSALKDTTSVPALVGLLADPYFTVRSAAYTALSAFGAAAVPDLAARVGEPSEKRMIHLRALGSIAAAIPDSARPEHLEARGTARRVLMSVLDRDRGPALAPERAAAVEFLLRWKDPDLNAFVRSRMADEYDPLVLQTYRREAKEPISTGRR